MCDEIGDVDALIIPGTRNSVSDLVALKESGLADEIKSLSSKIPIFGICGGYQILGKDIIDDNFKESKYGSVKGLALLDVQTRFGEVEKIVTQSQGKVLDEGMFECMNGNIIKGYELHEGLILS